MPTLRATPVSATEGAGFVDVLITLDAAATNEVRVAYNTLNGTANYSSSAPDFQRANGTLVFAPGETSKTVRVNLVNNTTVENTEVFWFELSSPVNTTIAQALAPVTVFDNDAAAGTPRITVDDAVVDERGKTASFQVWLSQPATSAVSVSYATANGTALAGSDYTAANGLLSFAPGERVKTVTVAITDDSLSETDETFKLLLSNASNGSLLQATGTARIGANDGATVGSPYVVAEPIAADESQALTGFVVRLSAPSTNEVRVDFDTLNGSANYSSSSPDFQRHTGTLVFAPGETTAFIPVILTPDTSAEKPEVFWLELDNPVNATVQQRFTPAQLIDNDSSAGKPIAQAWAQPFFDERSGTVNFFIWLDKPSGAVVNLNWVLINSLDPGNDLRLANGTVSFAPGETVKTVSTELLDDATAESIEDFQLVLTTGANTEVQISDFDARFRIAANDGPVTGTPYIRALPCISDESQALTGFTVLLSGPSTNEVRVTFDTLNATADYSSSRPEFQRHAGTLVFAPGETAKFVPVVIVDDSTVEGPQSFWFELSSPVNGIVTQRLTPGLIIDNDGTGTGSGDPLVSVGDAVVDEAAGTASFFLSLDRPAIQYSFVNYSTRNGTAGAGTDFTTASGTAHFNPGETSTWITVNLLDDGLAETDESFELVLTPGVGVALLDAQGIAVIGHNDTARVSQPVVSVAPITVSEADLLARFTVSLSAPSTNEVRISFDMANGTANYSSSLPDFQRHTGTLIFAPGETTKALVVPLIDDTRSESLETFTLTLGTPVNTTIAQTSIVATILDDDSGSALYSHGLSNDVYTVGSAADRIAESPGGGIDTVKSSVSYTLPDHLENLVLTGTAGTGIGNAGHNVFRGNALANTFEGQGGIDTAVFGGARAAYTVNGTATSRTVSGGSDNTDTLLNIERLQFSDTVLAYDTTPGGHTYAVLAMWQAAFNSAPSVQDLSRWTATLDRLGGNTRDLAQTLITTYAPGVPDDVLVAYLWSTIIGGTIPADQLNAFVGLVANGTYTQAGLLELVSTLELNTVEIAGLVGQPATLDPTFFPVPG